MLHPAILPVEPADVGEILTLQRAAYVTEAQRYADPFLPPLVESLEEAAKALTGGWPAFKAVLGHRIVGAVRCHLEDRTMHIGRLIVAPDQQGKGIGTALLAAIEAAGHGLVDRYALFTGDRSTATIRLYERLGYTLVRHEETKGLVHLEKAAPTT